MIDLIRAITIIYVVPCAPHGKVVFEFYRIQEMANSFSV